MWTLFAAITLTLEIQAACSGTTLKDFKSKLAEDEKFQNRIAALKEEVGNFASKFPLPGQDEL